MTEAGIFWIASYPMERLGSWSGHTASWLARAAQPRLPPRREDALAVPLGQTRLLAEFLGRGYAAIDMSRAIGDDGVVDPQRAGLTNLHSLISGFSA